MTLATAFRDATEGVFPPVDGAVTFLPGFPGPTPHTTLHAVVAFTGHAFIATSADPVVVRAAGADGYGMASSPAVLQSLVGHQSATFGVTDATLFSRGTGAGSSLCVRSDLEEHHRVRHARTIRRDVTVYGDERGLVTLGTGLAGRREMSVEAVPEGQGRGWGRSLIVDALGLVDEGDVVFAAVAPGNARSLRAFLGLGFAVIGSETIIVAGSS
jgi:hypothetical protein